MSKQTESDAEVKRDLEAHVEKVEYILGLVSGRLKARSESHDMSKTVEPELSIFNKYTPLLKTTEFGSDAYKEQLVGMGEGLKHHYQHNRHHPQYHSKGAEDMTLLDLMEMLADWKAASLRSKNGSMAGSIDYCCKEYKVPAMIQKILINTAKELKLFGGGMPE